jgi:hypothetical protein
MNQIARPQTALFKETAQHNFVRQVLTARFCACLVLSDRADLFCASPAAVHTKHPSIQIAEQANSGRRESALLSVNLYSLLLPYVIVS